MINLIESFLITEGEIKDKVASFVALTAGKISKNGNLWESSIVEDFCKKIMEDGSKKMWNRHNLKEDRDLNDWVATLISAEYIGERAVIRARLTDSDLGRMVAKEIEENPEEVGISVNIWCTVEQREIKVGRDIQTVNVPTEIVKALSVDFVSNPSVKNATALGLECILEEITDELTFEELFHGKKKSEKELVQLMEIIKGNSPVVSDSEINFSLIKEMKKGIDPSSIHQKKKMTKEEINYYPKLKFSDIL